VRYIGPVKRACIVGCSDGIGLATVRVLLADGWQVTGVSRSESEIDHRHYAHFQSDVATREYRDLLRRLAQQPFDAVIYCVGIGERLSLVDLERETRIFEVNLLAAVATAAIALPSMVAAGRGHLIVLSSLADGLVSAEYPSYNASKAGLSSYFAGLAAALRSTGVSVSQIRFGFVDTKLAKASVKPFMITREAAANVVVRSLRSGSRRVSFPLRMALLVAMLRCLQGLRRLWPR
jgi:short-subunit dehydrogenase